LKILHLADVAGIGGLQNWVCSLAEAQSRMGHDVRLMLPPWVASGARAFTALPVCSWDLSQAWNFDIVHSHGCAGLQNSGIMKRPSRPLIVQSYYGTILGIQIALRWFQNLVGWNGFDVPRNILWEAASGRYADAVIANSPKVRSEIVKFYRVRPAKISIVPAGFRRMGHVDDNKKKSLRRTLGLPEEGFLFLFVGRADPVKNLPAALAAFRRIRSRFSNVFLVIAPKQETSGEDQVLEVELAPDQMWQLYCAADALIHPGYYEAYSVAIHEALAYGLPAIIGRDTGNADYCTDGLQALVLPRKRGTPLVVALSEKMCSIVESSALRSKLGSEAARKFGPMDWAWVASEIENVYRKVQRPQ